MAARIPGVYVTVEDRSYVEDEVASGRSGLITVLSDRGPENRVVQQTSNTQFFRTYGKPNIDKNGQAHYIASQFLKNSNRLFVIRAALLDSPNPTHNCSLSNVIIRYTPSEGGTEEIISGEYIFTASGIGIGQVDPDTGIPYDEDNANTVFGNTFISKYVFCNYIGYSAINVDEYLSIDGSYESVKVIGKGMLTGQGTSEGNYIYYLQLETEYSGKSTESENGILPISLKPSVASVVTPLLLELNNKVTPPTSTRITEIHAIINPLVTTLNSYYVHLYDSNFYNDTTKFRTASRFYFGPKKKSEGLYSFTNGSNVVIAKNELSFETLYQEEWIMGETDFQLGVNQDSENVNILRQVVEKIPFESVNGEIIYKLILDDVYTGVSSTFQYTDSGEVDGNGDPILVQVANSNFESIYTHVPVQTISSKNVKAEKEFDPSDIYNLFYFYGLGVGSYYNNIYLQGVRNYQLEKMYTDDDGNVLHKYVFMDLTVYGKNPDGSKTILEGPWTVSLVNKINGQVVRNINTGRELYIVNTINEQSQYIRCKEGINASVLEPVLGQETEKEQLRLKIMALFSVSFVYRTKTRGQEGFYLENGGDGIQYDAYGRINLYHPEIQQLIRSAYSTELTSPDGTIQLLTYTLYPWYQIDYVLAGGYNVDAQSAARELVDSRNDCLLLADTGRYTYNAQEDLLARQQDIPWNTWNAAIYTQYREITDPYSGKKITISPVYHAISAHLSTDNRYFLSEPVAGIEKGALQERALLAYKPTIADMEEMIDVELNPVISEPDGTYILTQFTSYKRLSIMKRIHAVKTIHHLQKRLPSLLKGLLQRKGTPYWINVAKSIVNTFMIQFTDANSPKHSFSTFNIDLHWDEERSEIFIALTVKPLRAIEAINVNIIVV